MSQPALPFGFNETRHRRPAKPARVDPLVELVRGLRADAVKYRNAAARPSGNQQDSGIALGLDEAADRIEAAIKAEDAR